jgi:hypothetical protein
MSGAATFTQDKSILALKMRHDYIRAAKDSNDEIRTI